MFSEQSIASRPNFNQNVENARVLIEDAPWRDNPEKYRKVAEGILRRILTVDPRNESAKRLLLKAVAAVPRAKAPAVMKAPRSVPAVMNSPRSVPAQRPRPVSPELSFVVQKIARPVQKKKPARSPWGLVGVTAVVVGIAGILILVMK